MSIRTFVGAAVVVLSTTLTAQAATETFDLTQAGALRGSQSGYDFATGSGKNVSITAGRYNKRGVFHSGAVWQAASQGVGVCSRMNAATCKDNSRTDGRGANDMTFLDFGQGVTLQSITFGVRGKGKKRGMFDLFGTDGTSWSKIAGGLNRAGKGGDQTFTFASMYNGSAFGIGANAKRAGFFIKSVTVTYNQPQQPAAVPVPAGAALLLTGLAGLGVAAGRRRKKQS